MALPEQVLEFDFDKGLSEHEDQWLQAQGFLELENCIQDKAGALVKVPGYDPFTGLVDETGEPGFPSQPDSPAKLIQLDDRIGAASNGWLLSKGDEWSVQGRCSPWVLERRVVADVATRKPAFFTKNFDTVLHDCCVSGDWSFTAFLYWEHDDAAANSRICVIATKLSTGATRRFVTPAQSHGLTFPRILPLDANGNAILFYRREETSPTTWGTVCYRRVSSASGIFSEESLSLGCTVFDAWVDVASATAWVARHPGGSLSITDPEIELRSYSVAVSGSSVLTGTGVHVEATTGVPRAVAVSGSLAGDRVCVVFAETQSVGGGDFEDHVRGFARNSEDLIVNELSQFHIWNSADVFEASEDSITYRVTLIGITEMAPGEFYTVFFDPNGGTSGGYGGDFASASPVTRGFGIADFSTVPQYVGRARMRSRPFWDGERVSFLIERAWGDSPDGRDRNRYYAIVTAFPGTTAPARFRPMAYTAQGYAVGLPWSGYDVQMDDYWMLSSPYQDEVGAWHLQALERHAGSVQTSIVAYKLIQDDRVGSNFQLGGQAYLIGGLLSAWDGVRCLEAGWLEEPVIEAITQVSGTLTAGTRHYALTFARTNAQSEMLRSRPSEVITAANGASENNRLRIAPCCLTNRVDGDHLDMFVEVWRTKSGRTSPFYLVARIPMDANDLDVITHDDDMPDGSIGTSDRFPYALPYEEAPGAELANDPPISPVHGCVWRNRVWLTDGGQIAYSKEGVLNRAAEFSLNQTLPRATQQRITALAPLGEVLAVFCEDATAYVYGEGPAANGAGSTLTGPVELHTEIGCTQPSGLCVTPAGLLVPSRRGIQTLSLKREYSYVGAAIERTLAEFPRVRDCDWQKGTDRVWFIVAAQDGFTARFVIFDQLHGSWGTALGGVGSLHAPETLISVNDTQFWLNLQGVGRESNGAKWLASSFGYAQRIVTPWIKPGGTLAEVRFKRAWLLAQKLGSTGLTISVGYDFQDAWTHAVTFSAADLDAIEGVGDSDVLMLRIPSPRQRCHAFRLQIAEHLPVGSEDSQGFRFVAARFLTALRGAKGPLKATRNAGSGFGSE